MKKFSRLIAVGVGLGVMGAGLLGIAPATAAQYPVATTLSVSPSTVRSGESTVTIINSLSTGSFRFIGCQGSSFAGVENYADYNIGSPLIMTAESSPTPFNYSAENLVFGYELWSDVSCGAGGTRPAGSPDMTSGNITITPQLQIEPVTATAGSALVGSPVATEKSVGGNTPFEWDGGGAFTLSPSSACSLSFAAVDTAALPTGLSLDETTSASNTAPVITLTGAPAVGTEGSYRVCVNLSDSFAHGAFAWLDVTVMAPPVVVPALANTGANDAAVPATIAGSLLALVFGSCLAVRRQRRKATA